MWRWGVLILSVVTAIGLILYKNPWTRFAGIVTLTMVAGWALATAAQPGGFELFAARAAAKGDGAKEILADLDDSAKSVAKRVTDNPEMGKG